MDWILDRRYSNRIAAVAHVGDITNRSDWFYAPMEFSPAWDKYSQLNNATAAGTLAAMPWGTCGGNHDDDECESRSGWQHYIDYFGPSKFTGKPWYVARSTNNIDSPQVFRAMGYEFLLINLSSAGRYPTMSDTPGAPPPLPRRSCRGTSSRYPEARARLDPRATTSAAPESPRQ